jgi:hypothetical protein
VGRDLDAKREAISSMKTALVLLLTLTLAATAQLALALPASAQELETRRSKIDDLAAHIQQCKLEREFGGGGDCLRKTEELRLEIMRKFAYRHPLFCEAYRGGRWVQKSCWDD